MSMTTPQVCILLELQYHFASGKDLKTIMTQANAIERAYETERSTAVRLLREPREALALIRRLYDNEQDLIPDARK